MLRNITKAILWLSVGEKITPEPTGYRPNPVVKLEARIVQLEQKLDSSSSEILTLLRRIESLVQASNPHVTQPPVKEDNRPWWETHFVPRHPEPEYHGKDDFLQ